MEEIPLYGMNGKPSWFLKLNPDGTVPVLVCDGDLVMTESEVILDFLNQGTEKTLPSENKKEQKLVNHWRELVSCKVIPIGKNAVQSNTTPKNFLNLLEEIDNKIVGPFLCGDKITIADCAAFPFLWRIHETFGFKNSKNQECQILCNWLSRCKKEEAFRKTIEQNWWWWW